MNHLRRIISLLLVLVLCFGLIPGVSAAEVDTPGADIPTEVTEETAPPTTEDTTPTEEPAPEEPPAEDSPPEESIPDAESTEPSTEPSTEDVTQDGPGIMGLSPGDSSTWAIGSTQKSIMLFDYADNGNYTTVLNSQVACAYKPNGSGTTRTAYIKNLGWHFARYGGVPYPDDPLYCIEPWRSYAASTSGNSVDRDVTLDGSGSTTGSNVWYTLPAARREAIGLILLYSNQMWNHSISVTTTSKANNPNTGQSVEGWHITVYSDEACTQKVGTLITNEDGRAGYYLDPGTYWAKETGDEHGRFEDEYWMVDETVQKFEIKPHEDVSITFTNIQYGRLKITKTVEGGGSVEGWQFKITDAEGKVLDGSPFATDEDGIILTGNLLPGTDAYGKTKAENLNLGLYLVVETKVPEMVVSTTDPFLVSVPMTSVNGTNATDGGTRWIYDITLYPKNLTGIPSLEKTLRENQNDTGRHQGSASSITDGYAHTGTASAGDTIDYQIISTLPSITSESTYLSCYTFVDTLSKGLTYNKGDVVLEFFTDAACTDLITTWKEADGKFSVVYNTTDAGESVMTIEMTAAGLTEISTSKAVYSGASMVNSGYSDCTLRITYAAKMDSSKDLVFGDNGNDNKVVLTWKRSSQNYYDTLVDDCHVFTYGIDLTKLFSDGQGDFSKVEFLIQNKTDNYFVKAELNKTDGVYYVVDHVTDKADATHFVPVKTADAQGRIIVKGLEDDTYTLTEVRTDNGYVMLKQGIDVVISRKDTADSCGIYGTDVLGLIQNDPRYASIIHDSGDLHNMPQKHLEHKLLTASAAVDGKKVTMLEDNGSVNAEAPLTVVNTRGFDLPKTGDNGTLLITLAGVLLMAGSVTVLLILNKKKLH